MLKQIRVDQLRLGMHLKEFCGSWMDHPFWRTGFVINDPQEISLIVASNIQEVWIDCSQGADVAPGEPVMCEEESLPVVAVPVAGVPKRVKPPQETAPRPSAQEIERAARICQQSRSAVAFMFEEVRMGKAVDVNGVREVVEDISDSMARNSTAIISLARLKTADDYTYMHSVAVCALMVALAGQLGLDESQVRSCGVAGLLHDLGKVAVPMEVLNKPGKLTVAEFDIIKTHPTEGHKMLMASHGVDPVAFDVVLHHHEKMDGSGYPKQLKGEQISLYARMGAVCDVYDAITSNRPYKSGWDPAESLHQMAKWAHGHFDPKVFQAFIKGMGIYPVGSLVRLTSGRIGVVTEQSAKSLTLPIIKVFFSTKANMRIAPETLDLSQSGTQDRIQSRENPALWKFPDLHQMWSGLSYMC